MKKNGFLNSTTALGVVIFFLITAFQEKDLSEQVGTFVHTEGSYSYNITVLYDKNEEKTDRNITYYWYRNGNMKRTVGDYSGNVLHRSFEKFDGLGNLIEKGQFIYGAKDGSWKFWNHLGKLQRHEEWEKGYLQTKFTFNGDTTFTSRYKNNKLDGLQTQSIHGKVVSKKRYKLGIEKVSSKKKQETNKAVKKSKNGQKTK